jgi:hypothetical protein
MSSLLGGSTEGRKSKTDTVSRGRTFNAVLEFLKASQRLRSHASQEQPNHGKGLGEALSSFPGSSRRLTVWTHICMMHIASSQGVSVNYTNQSPNLLYSVKSQKTSFQELGMFAGNQLRFRSVQTLKAMQITRKGELSTFSSGGGILECLRLAHDFVILEPGDRSMRISYWA